MFRNKVSVIGLLVLLPILVACGPAGQVEEITDPTPTVPVSSGIETGGYADFVDSLRLGGVVIEPSGEVEQPFFSVTGQSIEVDGAQVQVFEYIDEPAREADSSQITPDGSTVGGTSISWVDRPNFWAEGRLIVLYVGSDESVVNMLTRILGEPVTQATALPPYAVVAAEQMLSEELSLSVEEIDYVSHEREDWPDACLGLGGVDEICAQVITPGWRVVLRAGGREYVFRADQNGEVVRREGAGEPSEGDVPTVVAQGEFVGVAGHQGAGTAFVVRLPDGSAVLRLEEFSVTDGPDLYVYLVSGAEPASSADFGEYVDLGLLESNEGNQEYAIPGEADLDDYQSAVIFCLAYDVLFASAPLTE